MTGTKAQQHNYYSLFFAGCYKTFYYIFEILCKFWGVVKFVYVITACQWFIVTFKSIHTHRYKCASKTFWEIVCKDNLNPENVQK